MPLIAPHAVMTFPNGTQAKVHPGDEIGRRQCLLGLDDPRISLAHAQVALRAGRLRMLALRGTLWLEGSRRADVALRRGQSLVLCSGLFLEVDEVVVPPEVHCLEVGRTSAPLLITQSVSHMAEDGSLRPGDRTDRVCISCEAGWRYRPAHGTWQPLLLDQWMHHEALDFRVRRLPASDVDSSTVVEEEDPPLLIKSWVEETEVRIGERPPIRLARTTHSILRELRRLNLDHGPVHWQQIAERIWPFNHDRQTLWHTKRSRMRREFRRLGLPHWLLRIQNGIVELSLRDQDRFELLGQ